MKEFLIVAIAYLLGSVPTAYIMAKWTKGIDIRDYGSGNVGFTNALRTIGRGPAFIVLFGDVLKGVIAAWLGVFYGGPILGTLTGMAVLIGHNHPVFLGFKGGKGAATGLGVILALMPVISVIAILVWGAVVFITRYVSLGTILAAISVPILALVFREDIAYILFVSVGAAFVVYKHRGNISRLLRGQEYKIGEKART